MALKTQSTRSGISNAVGPPYHPGQRACETLAEAILFLGTSGHLIPPSDPGPVCPRGTWAPLEAARHVPDTRSDESAQAEAIDRALEGALRSVLTPFEAGVIRRRYWNGWTWEEIGRYYFPDRVWWGTMPGHVRVVHDRAIRALREALR